MTTFKFDFQERNLVETVLYTDEERGAYDTALFLVPTQDPAVYRQGTVHLSLPKHHIKWETRSISTEEQEAELFTVRMLLPEKPSAQQMPLPDAGNIMTYRWIPEEVHDSLHAVLCVSFAFPHMRSTKTCVGRSSNDSEKYDRISGIYEGGFKIWDCSLDLGGFLLYHSLGKSNDTEIRRILSPYLAKTSLRVLDIGSGQGLVALAAAHGMSSLRNHLESQCEINYTLQDYDIEVLSHSTISNVRSNLSMMSATCMDNFTFLQVTWKALVRILRRDMHNAEKDHDTISGIKPFEILVGSDILFSPESCDDIASLLVINAMRFYSRNNESANFDLKELLSPIAFIGTKKHYFGTNGSVQYFLHRLRALSKDLRLNAPPNLSLPQNFELQPTSKTHWTSPEKDRVILSIAFHVS